MTIVLVLARSLETLDLSGRLVLVLVLVLLLASTVLLLVQLQ